MKKYFNKNYLTTLHLTDKDTSINYLNTLCNNENDFIFGLNCVVIAHGFDKLAKDSDLGVHSLYKALSVYKEPQFNTILKILHTLGFGIKIVQFDHNNSSRIIREHSLMYLYPKIAIEWHPFKNGKLTPNDILPGSRKKIWWRCLKNIDHKWQQSCNYRINDDVGCTYCKMER